MREFLADAHIGSLDIVGRLRPTLDRGKVGKLLIL